MLHPRGAASKISHPGGIRPDFELCQNQYRAYAILFTLDRESSFVTSVMRRAYNLFIQPRFADDNGRRREFILNVVLYGSLAVAVVGLVLVVANVMAMGRSYQGESPMMALDS